LPLFALANAGVHLDVNLVQALTDPITLGVILGLVVGKPVGVVLFSWIALRTGRCALPDGVTWGQILGAGLLAGIGFTMSLFVSELAFGDPALVSGAKIGILIASLTAGVIGFIVLHRTLPPGAES
jgi:NhaA family Na+:H+ antiporter